MSTASIWAPDGSTRTIVDIRPGDRIEWKRNGQLGTVFGTVDAIDILRVRVSPDGGGRRVWISNRMCAVWRDGKRVYA